MLLVIVMVMRWFRVCWTGWRRLEPCVHVMDIQILCDYVATVQRRAGGNEGNGGMKEEGTVNSKNTLPMLLIWLLLEGFMGGMGH